MALWPFGKKQVQTISAQKHIDTISALTAARQQAEQTGKDEILLNAAYDRILAALDKIRQAVAQQKAQIPAMKRKTQDLADHEKTFDDFLMNDMDPRARGSAYRNLLIGLKMVAMQRAKQDLKMGRPVNIQYALQGGQTSFDKANAVFNKYIDMAQNLENEAKNDLTQFNRVVSNADELIKVLQNELDPAFVSVSNLVKKIVNDFKESIKDIEASKEEMLGRADQAETEAKEFSDRFRREVIALREATAKMDALKKQLLGLQAGTTMPQRMRELQLARINIQIKQMQEEIAKITARMNAAAAGPAS